MKCCCTVYVSFGFKEVYILLYLLCDVSSFEMQIAHTQVLMILVNDVIFELIDSIVKKAQQRLYFLRQLRKFNLPQELLKQFYSTIIESARQ